MAFNAMNDPYHIQEHKVNEHFAQMLHNVQLVYARENHLGAKLYVDPLDTYVVKLENVPTNPEPYVMVRFQEDRYISARGLIFLITPKYEDMNPQGIVPHTRAYIKPLQEAAARPNDARTTKSALHVPSDPLQPESKVSTETTQFDVSHVHVTKVMLDQKNVVLYRNCVGVFYCTPMYSMHTYPLENIIKVYHDEKGEPMALEDDCKNQFRIVHK